MQTFTAKIHISSSDTINSNSDIQLPDLPLTDSEDVIRMETRLTDPEFVNQMVNI